MAHADDPDFDDKLAALADERVAMGESTDQQAKRLLAENLVPAVLSICNTALHSPNDKLRFDAAKYVVERNLGRVTDAGDQGAGKDVFEELLAEMAAHGEGNH